MAVLHKGNLVIQVRNKTCLFLPCHVLAHIFWLYSCVFVFTLFFSEVNQALARQRTRRRSSSTWPTLPPHTKDAKITTFLWEPYCLRFSYTKHGPLSSKIQISLKNWLALSLCELSLKLLLCFKKCQKAWEGWFLSYSDFILQPISLAWHKSGNSNSLTLIYLIHPKTKV